MNFPEAISPKNKAKHINEVIDIISPDESPNKMDSLYIEPRSNIANTNANKEATQEEYEKLEDGNNNPNVDEPMNKCTKVRRETLYKKPQVKKNSKI